MSPAVAPVSASPLTPSGRLSRVLVIDDDEAVRLRVDDLLSAAGRCEVIEAANGFAGLAAAAEHRPDLILLDIMMPGMSGIEVCTALRQNPRTREIPIIVLSAADESSAMPAALAAGAEDYLPKPIPAVELRAKVANVLRLNRFHAIETERRRLRWLVEESSDALLVIDRRGRLLEANRQARDLFAFPANDEPTDALSLIARHFQPEPADALDRLRAAAPDATVRHRFTLVRPESSLPASRWLEADVFADETDPAGSLLLKIADRSDAVHRGLGLRTFQHLVSHKLRTPLSGLSSLLALLRDDPGSQLPRELADLLALASQSADRLESSVASILRYHETLCGSRDLTPAVEPLPATALLTGAAAVAGLESRLLTFAGDTPPEIPTTMVSPLRLALTEVFDNYRKFSEAPRAGLTITFRAPSAGPALIEIRAHGPAVPPDALAQLGQPYLQLESSFTGEVPGMGLGLATARLLLRSLGARLGFSAGESPSGLITTLTLPPASH